MIEIACATDDGYAPHCGAMLNSLLAQHERGAARVHVVHGASLSEANRSRLQQLGEKAGAKLNLLPITEARLAGFPSRRFHEACWYRILLPELLPANPRVLYLDSDTIVMANLRELWETGLGGRVFGAVTNPLYPFMPPRWRELGLPQAQDYLNSGVLLMDLDRMRAEQVCRRVEAYAAEHPDNIWPEQDALSVVCQGQWLRLPPRWNAQTTLFDLAASQLPFEPDQAEAARTDPAIVHFIGPLKPWHYLCRHPLQAEYAKHRRKTPWPESGLEGRTLLNRLLKPFSLGMQVRLRQLMRKQHLAW